ncbi:MAG: hypothetical protein AAFU71_07410, partial [Cyanobacteria bacterium J06632_22]
GLGRDCPAIVSTFRSLGRSLALSGRYQDQGDEAVRQRAMALARQCAKLRPNDLKVLTIAGQSLPSPKHSFAFRGKTLVLGVAVGAGMVGLGLLGAINLPRQSESPGPETSEAIPLETSAATPVADFGDSASTQAEVDIPLQFEDGTLVIDPRLSRLSNYEERSFYKLQGVLLNQGQTELVSLNLKVEYLDASGGVILEESSAVLRDSDAPLRPGDTYPVYLIEEMNPNLAAIRLTVTTRDQLPAPASYEASPKVDYDWDLIPPSNMDLEMTARRDQFDQYSSSAYHDAVYAFTNTGEVAIQQLKLHMKFFNDRDTPIGENDVLVVYGDDAPILPGETRPVRTIQSLPKDYARYTVTVVEAE